MESPDAGHHDRHDSRHGHQHHGTDDRLAFDSTEMAEFAQLEGELLIGIVERAVATVADQCVRLGLNVRTVIDLGSGPGVGTCVLAQRFSGATVNAVDGSATMLGFAAARAEQLGLDGRVHNRLLDLHGSLSELGHADVVWASMVLHHIGDEVDALRRIGGLLTTGLVAVIERADQTRVLYAGIDAARPGIWERFDCAWDAWFADMRAELPHASTSSDYREMIQAAGFEVLVDEVLTLEIDAPLDAQASRFAHRHLRHTRAQLDAYADPTDLTALDDLLDTDIADGSNRFADAELRLSRHLYIARPITGP